jgi:parallel beta-helix repeat protein
MRRIAFALALIVCGLESRAATTADLSVTLVGAPKQVRIGQPIQWTAAVANLGPDPARNVSFHSRLNYAPYVCFDGVLPLLAVGGQYTVRCSGTATSAFYLESINVGAFSFAQTDPVPDNDRAFAQVDILTLPDTDVSIDVPTRVDAGIAFPVTVSVRNLARVPATGVIVTIDVDGAAGIARAPEGCTVSGTHAVCSLGTIEPWTNPAVGEKRKLTIEPLAPDVSLAPINVAAEVKNAEGDQNTANDRTLRGTHTYLTYLVTTDADSGSGSLRSAIDAVNSACIGREPCKIAFRIPPGSAKWVTIRPATPLPLVTTKAPIQIDGTTQTRFYGDANPSGPEVEINGGGVSGGDGLHYSGACFDLLRGVAINGFPGSGVYLQNPATCSSSESNSIMNCYFGTDATGTIAVPNERGIVSEASVAITDNVISGNRRAGVFITGSGVPLIRRNTIGLSATRTAGLGNGASGVYVGVAGVDVLDNFIGFNHDAGVSIARNAVDVEVSGNSIQANWHLGIDYALDGVSQSITVIGTGPQLRDLPASAMGLPDISSAVYDAVTDTTTISGRMTGGRVPGAFDNYSVALFANDEPDASGYGEGQYAVGGAAADSSGRFTFEMKGRPPGPWVTATGMDFVFWGFLRMEDPDHRSYCGDCGSTTTTTEFSRAVRVLNW